MSKLTKNQKLALEKIEAGKTYTLAEAVQKVKEITEDDTCDYIVGETVKVNYGPFSGFTGVIEEVNAEKKKLKVMVKIFGRKTPLELENSQVERE